MSLLTSYEKVIIRMGSLCCDLDEEAEENEGLLEWGPAEELEVLLSDLHDIKRIFESWGSRLEDALDDAELVRLADSSERRVRTWLIEECPECDGLHGPGISCMEYEIEKAEYMEER